MKKIFVTFQIEGIHCFPEAATNPKFKTGDWDDVSFLANPHRHMFHFKIEMEVFHDDRDVEFIQLKRWAQKQYSDNVLQLDYKSCEMMAEELLDKLSSKYNTNYGGVGHRFISVEISEDGENGAHVSN